MICACGKPMLNRRRLRCVSCVSKRKTRPAERPMTARDRRWRDILAAVKARQVA